MHNHLAKSVIYSLGYLLEEIRNNGVLLGTLYVGNEFRLFKKCRLPLIFHTQPPQLSPSDFNVFLKELPYNCGDWARQHADFSHLSTLAKNLCLSLYRHFGKNYMIKFNIDVILSNLFVFLSVKSNTINDHVVFVVFYLLIFRKEQPVKHGLYLYKSGCDYVLLHRL